MCAGEDPETKWSADAKDGEVTILYDGVQTTKMPIGAAVRIFGALYRQSMALNRASRPDATAADEALPAPA